MANRTEPAGASRHSVPPGLPLRDGLLIVDKPEGPTSHDIVDLARQVLGIRKIGHTGTLDPMASGVLVLVLGRATRLARLLGGHDKSYAGEGQLGQSTDTFDRTGQADGEPADFSGVTARLLREAAARLTGQHLQIPPPYSARKVAGEPLYRRARRGEPVAGRPAPVCVQALEVQLGDGGQFTFSCRVSAGTYVRSLVHDLGRDLGCGAHLTALRRTRVADAFGLDRAVDTETLRRNPAEVLRGPAFLSFDDIPLDLPAIEVPASAVEGLRHGRPVRAVAGPAETGAAVLQARAEDGRLLALVEPMHEEGVFQPRTVFPPPEGSQGALHPPSQGVPSRGLR